jgi:hypothetical protein
MRIEINPVVRPSYEGSSYNGWGDPNFQVHYSSVHECRWDYCMCLYRKKGERIHLVMSRSIPWLEVQLVQESSGGTVEI